MAPATDAAAAEATADEQPASPTDGDGEGSASGTAVGGDSGVTGVAKYTNGVIVYVGAQKGLMAGGSVGLQMFKYKSIADANSIYN